jgi:hypothetical protein
VQVLTHKYKLQYLVLPLLSEVATGGIIIIEICTSENNSGTDVHVHNIMIYNKMQFRKFKEDKAEISLCLG